MRKLVGAAAVAGVAIFGGAGAFDDNTTRNDNGEIVEGGGLGVMAIQSGDCLQLPSEEQEIQSLEAVNCDVGHTAQSTGTVTVAHTGPYDDYAVATQAERQCAVLADTFAGGSLAGTEYTSTSLYPLEAGWNAGDKEANCLIVRWDYGMITGDLEGRFS